MRNKLGLTSRQTRYFRELREARCTPADVIARQRIAPHTLARWMAEDAFVAEWDRTVTYLDLMRRTEEATRALIAARDPHPATRSANDPPNPTTPLDVRQAPPFMAGSDAEKTNPDTPRDPARKTYRADQVAASLERIAQLHAEAAREIAADRAAAAAVRSPESPPDAPPPDGDGRERDPKEVTP
jgi:hypothetical protein